MSPGHKDLLYLQTLTTQWGGARAQHLPRDTIRYLTPLISPLRDNKDQQMEQFFGTQTDRPAAATAVQGSVTQRTMWADVLCDLRAPHPANPRSPSCTERKMMVKGLKLFHFSPSHPWKHPVIKTIIILHGKRNILIKK